MQAQRIWGRSALLVAMVGLFSSCTIGDTDDVDGELIGFASNQKLRNGCLPTEKVAACAARKVSSLQVPCLYRQRAPNAYFKIVFFTGTPPVEPGWTYEHDAVLLPTLATPYVRDDAALDGRRIVSAAKIAEIQQLPLGQACSQYGYEHVVAGDKHMGTYVPTELGCSGEGGIWRNGICVAW